MFSWTQSALQKRAALVAQVIKKYYPNPPIPLDHSDPYTLMVAVILSAHSSDAGVNKITPKLFDRAPTPLAMSKITEAELLPMIRSCGLAPSKAKNLIANAKILVEKFKGKVPQDREELENLPGVGRKTAGVVLSQAFGIPAFPVDRHILRSANRWGLSKGNIPEKVEMDLCEIYPKKDWIKLHLRMIHYARNYCTARGCFGPFGKEGEKKCPLCEKLGGI